jgi:dihydrodipicolinate synthase/N-acetylneuraminate lyase
MARAQHLLGRKQEGHPVNTAQQASKGPPTGWRGIFPSLPTPFTEDDSVDHEALSKIVEYVVAEGATGVVCLGLAGEVETLTIPEREEIAKTVTTVVNGRVPVLAGATAENQSRSMHLAQHLQSAGADGIVLPPPTTTPLDVSELTDFFVGVARAVRLPVIIQDAPQHLGSPLSPELVTAASQKAPNICAVKQELGPEYIRQWIAALPDGFAVFSGNGGLHLLDTLEAGAAGIMPAADLTDILVRVYNAWAGQRRDDATELFIRVLPLIVYEMQSMPHANRCAKYILRKRGLPLRPHLRRPATPLLTAHEIDCLDRHVTTARLDIP